MSVAEYREGNDFSEWLLVELFRAYEDARKGKRGTQDEQLFEGNILENLCNLRNQILDWSYSPGRSIAFITREPVIREIFAASFADRVVHHLLYNIVYDWWDRHFIYDTYSCRVGKGTDFGVQRIAKHMRSISENYTKEAYYVKLDIQGYFMSLPRKKLFEKAVEGLERQFPNKGKVYHLSRFLWKVIIFDNPVEGVVRKGLDSDWLDLPRTKSLFCQPEGYGIVIGNLTSQLLSNIYLDAMDRYIVYNLGYKYYGRYVDDFVFYVTKDQLDKALIDIRRIERFLSDDLELILHPKKRQIQNINKGVPFLGCVIYPNNIVPGRRMIKKFRNAALKFESGQMPIESVISYIGRIDAMNGRKITSQIFNDVPPVK